MSSQGILVVHPGWKEGDAAVLDRQTYQRHEDALQDGTRVLFYMKEPVDALVGEAQATGAPTHAESEPEAHVLDPAVSANPSAHEPTHRMETTDQHPLRGGTRFDQRTYNLPYRMLHSPTNQRWIPLGIIRERIGSEFGVFDDEWIPLSSEHYNALVGEWEQGGA